MKHSITPEEHARVQRRRGRQALGLLVAILLGGIWALLLILCKKKGRKDFVPYSPGFILCGIIVYLLK